MRLLSLVLLLGLLVAAPATSDASPRFSTRLKRAAHALRYRLPAFLRGQTDDVDQLFGKTLVADPSTRTGLGTRSERTELARALVRRLPDATRAAIGRATGSPRDFIEPVDLDQAPRVIRDQLAHSIRQLGDLVDEVAAGGLQRRGKADPPRGGIVTHPAA